MRNLIRGISLALLSVLLIACQLNDRQASEDHTENPLRIATFNVSVEATNYLSREVIANDPSQASIVTQHLKSGSHRQLKNIAEIIQRTRPDILLLNEFDYIANPNEGIKLFIDNYLSVSHNGQDAIDYPYFYIAPSNTGLATPFDLDNDENKSGNGADAMGFGYYPGQYGMALLSRYPINENQVRTLQEFLWKDMPNALEPIQKNGKPWYSEEEWSQLRLASKSFWDVPIDTPLGVIHIIASHPTPPTFDGEEDRNGKRNHDEIRLITDYLSSENYLYDDEGTHGGLETDARFVVLGDLNASPNEGDAIKTGIQSLLTHKLINSRCIPTSKGGQQTRPDNHYSAQHTAAWGLRVDYVLPSRQGLKLSQCGVYWPSNQSQENYLIADRAASSDHRLVWIDVVLGD